MIEEQIRIPPQSPAAGMGTPQAERTSATTATPSSSADLNSEIVWLAGPERAWTVLFWSLLVYFVAVVGRLAWDDRIHLFYEAGLLYLIIIGALGPAFLRARRDALRMLLNRYAKDDPVFEPLYAHFVERHQQGWRPTLAGLGTGVFFLFFRWNISWELLPYQLSASRVFITLLGALACGLFVRALWQLLGFGMLVSGMSRELEIRGARLFSLELFERAGAGYARTAFGASFLSLGLFWLAMSSRSLIMDHPAALAETLPAVFLVLILALIIPLAYLIVPIWRLHRIMAQRKDEIRRLFAEEHTAVERRFLEQPNREMAQAYLQGRQVIEEINNLPEWPFRFEMLAKLLTLVAIPAALFIFKEIVVDVAVELLKHK